VSQTGRDLVGRDLASPLLRVRNVKGLLPVALAVAVGAALLIATLRIEILRTRYRLAQVATEGERLRDERDQALIEARRLRDPERLARLARQLGFGNPRRVIDLEPVSAPGARKESR
jgi:hypothetical protein